MNDTGVIIIFSYLLFDAKLPRVLSNIIKATIHIMIFITFRGIISGNIRDVNRYINPIMIRKIDANRLAILKLLGNTLYLPPQDASA